MQSNAAANVEVGSTLPAYAHNDYENARPLFNALELGYRGVEADYYVVDGALVVGHDPEDLHPERTLESLYLAPRRDLVVERGRICSDGSIFTLNIESKEAGEHTYAALHELLGQYAEMLTIVRNGVETAGPIQVVLVGWHPPLTELAKQRVRYVSVQSHFDELPKEHASYPSHLLRMISVQYKSQFTWQGGARVPARFGRRLDAVLEARDAVPGRILRVFRVPPSVSVYRALLRGGVDLIGTKSIVDSRALLLEATREVK